VAISDQGVGLVVAVRRSPLAAHWSCRTCPLLGQQRSALLDEERTAVAAASLSNTDPQLVATLSR
jgi:hypothetical protein